MVTDPRADHQSFIEVSYVNLPTTESLGSTDVPLHYMDVAIPCNNAGALSEFEVDAVWEILQMCGTISGVHPWEA